MSKSFKKEALSKVDFYVLMALYQNSASGYGIIQRVEYISTASRLLSSETIYRELNILIEKWWITEIGSPQDRMKQYYEITELGKEKYWGDLERICENVMNVKRVLKK